MIKSDIRPPLGSFFVLLRAKTADRVYAERLPSVKYFFVIATLFCRFLRVK